MNILWLAWKDTAHPLRGGAELVMGELINRQARDGHRVTLLTASYKNAKPREILPNGVEVIRVGSNRYTHPVQALAYFIRHLRGKFDVIIETVNTAPYFSLLFRGKAQGLALYHQLAREVWYAETKSPLSHLGYYVIEPLSTWLLSRSKVPLVTVSESTKKDLARFGWKQESTHIISEGIGIEPLPQLDTTPKYDQPTMVSLGSIRSMKQTLDQVQAFELAKQVIPSMRLKIAGDASDAYGQKVLAHVANSPFRSDIEYLGRVSEQQKQTLLARAHVITVTSIKEGWGLIVTQAASQGTPAVVYDADGLRDSVRHNQTGLITTPTPQALARNITRLLTDPQLYQKLRYNAWQWSKQMTFDHSYQDLKYVMEKAIV